MSSHDKDWILVVCVAVAAIWWKRTEILDVLTTAGMTVLTRDDVLVAIPGLGGYGLDWGRIIAAVGILVLLPILARLIVKMIIANTLLGLVTGRGDPRSPRER